MVYAWHISLIMSNFYRKTKIVYTPMEAVGITVWLFILLLLKSTEIIECTENRDSGFDGQNVAVTPFYIFPDDVGMAEIRCQEVLQTNNHHLKKLWLLKEFPDDNVTHCYIKCYLKRLGLISLISRGLDHDKLYQLWDNMDLESTDFCLGELDLASELDGTCASYYEKWMHLRHNCAEFIKNTFYELGPIFQYPRKFQLPTKTVGMSAIEFCNSLDADVDSSEVTDMATISSENDTFDSKLSCVFKRFYYFDAYGRLDPTEIIRSFKDASVDGIMANTEYLIKQCAHHANAKYSIGENSELDMANELNRCLTDRFGATFKIVINERDKFTRRI